MRKRNSGTWDPAKRQWKIKGKISMTVKKLSEHFREEVPPTKQGSQPFWIRYLDEQKEKEVITRKAIAPLQKKIASLEYLIAQFKREGKPTEQLEKELAEAIGTTEAQAVDLVDEARSHPDINLFALQLALDDRSLLIDFLNGLINKNKPTTPPKLLLKDEIEKVLTAQKTVLDAIEDKKIRRRKMKVWGGMKLALNYYLDAVGNVPLVDMGVAHWRTYWAKIQSSEYGQVTQWSMTKRIKFFLKQIESNHNLNYGFLRSSEFRLKSPEGQRIGYTIEQMKTALQNSTGITRSLILLGINCGFYFGDIEDLEPTNFEGDFIQKGRTKTKALGVWWVFEETKNNMVFGITPKQANYHYSRFAKRFDLPEHKALRKGVAQWIENHPDFGEEVARMYRAEKRSDTHNNFYSLKKVESFQNLTSALKALEVVLFGN